MQDLYFFVILSKKNINTIYNQQKINMLYILILILIIVTMLLIYLCKQNKYIEQFVGAMGKCESDADCKSGSCCNLRSDMSKRCWGILC